MNISVRKAEEKDLSLVKNGIYKLAEFENFTDSCTITAEALHKLMFEENAIHALIAECDGSATGIALYYFNRIATFAGKRILYIEDLFVDEAFRGAGIGTKILDTLREIGAEENCTRLEWKCLDWNKNASDFYENYGAKRSDGWITYNYNL